MTVKGDEQVPRKKNDPTRPVRVDEDVYDALQVLAAIFRKTGAPQFTSDILRPIVAHILAAHGIEFPIKAKPESIPEAIKAAIGNVAKPPKSKGKPDG